MLVISGAVQVYVSVSLLPGRTLSKRSALDSVSIFRKKNTLLTQNCGNQSKYNNPFLEAILIVQV